MIKSELISTLVGKLRDISERDITQSISLIVDSMSDALSSGQRIEIRGFGSFSLHYRPPRNAHNPKTGDKVITQAKYSPHFKPGKSLRERVNASKDYVAIRQEDDDGHEEEDGSHHF
jgi:integration host factor subunit beta